MDGNVWIDLSTYVLEDFLYLLIEWKVEDSEGN